MKHTIPPRSRQANGDMIDLTGLYTGSLDDPLCGSDGAFESLPRGVQVFAGCVFDVRGVVLAGPDAPRREIPVSHAGPTIHVLHAACGAADIDERLGEYRIRYADGSAAALAITAGRTIGDLAPRNGAPLPTETEVAWSDAGYALYEYSAKNPFPDRTIDVIELVCGSAPSIVLVGLTIEPAEPVYEQFSMARIDVFCPIPARSPDANPDLVDLSAHYTSSLEDNWFCHAGHDLRDLPRGVQTLGGTRFDIRGLVQLAASKSIDVTGVVFPESVHGIAVGRAGARLHFLQACFWNTIVDAKLGDYVIHYANGETARAPIVYGRNTTDWWARPGLGDVSDAETVWRGTNPATTSMGLTTHLIRYTWESPLPEVKIDSIDIVSDLIEAGPFVVAITVEPR